MFKMLKRVNYLNVTVGKLQSDRQTDSVVTYFHHELWV